MIVVSQPLELRQRLADARRQGRKIGCVPTMGALHDGHLSLIRMSVERTDVTVVTIFVNPTQFAPTEDLAKYPRPLEDDLQACREAGADIVFMPEVPALYPEGFDTWVSVDGMSQVLEGEFRPTHFRGVTTIVLKLFNLVQPDVAVFGAKDYQQQTMIRRMVRDLDLPIDIVIGATVRDPDRLAMSSRNRFLSVDERRSALSLSRSLRLAEEKLQSGDNDVFAIEQAMHEELTSVPLVEVDYAVIVDADSLERITQPRSKMVALVAARVGKTRLIDNLVIPWGTGNNTNSGNDVPAVRS